MSCSRRRAPHGLSLALVLMRRGELVFERYGAQPDTAFGPGGPVDAGTTLISWSMAKSITHAAIGILVGDGVLDPKLTGSPCPVGEALRKSRSPCKISWTCVPDSNGSRTTSTIR